MSTERKYLRAARLTLVKPRPDPSTGVGSFFGLEPTNALQIDDLRLTFDVKRSLGATPNSCTLTVTNLAERTRDELAVTPLVALLDVGYAGGELRRLFDAAGGNLGAAVKMTVLGLILGSLATPFYVQWLMGATVPVDLLVVFSQIAFIVFLPMVAGHLTQSQLIAKYGQNTFQSDWAPRFPPFSTLGVLGIVFVAMALKAPQLVAQPGELPQLLLPLLALYGINYLLSTAVARLLLPRGDAIALVYGTVMRNLSIALALAMNAFGNASSDAALVITLAYIIQVQSAAWYVKLTDRLFGAKQNP